MLWESGFSFYVSRIPILSALPESSFSLSALRTANVLATDYTLQKFAASALDNYNSVYRGR